MLDIDLYLKNNFLCRESAEDAMRDFSIFKRRVNKWRRGTNGTHSIFNLVKGIEYEFEPEFIDHILATRFTSEERAIYQSCLRIEGKQRSVPHNIDFFVQLEKELWKAKHR